MMSDPYIVGMMLAALLGWGHALWRGFRADREAATYLSRAEAAEARVRELERDTRQWDGIPAHHPKTLGSSGRENPRMTLFLESPCSHGETTEHAVYESVVKAIEDAAGEPIPPGVVDVCPGGSRTEVTIDYSKGLNHLLDKWWDEVSDLDVFTEAVNTALGLTEGDTG